MWFGLMWVTRERDSRSISPPTSVSTVYCLLFTVYCLLSTVNTSILSILLFLGFKRKSLLACCLLSTVYCLLSTVYCLLSTVYLLATEERHGARHRPRHVEGDVGG
jgi:hypothetical protein